MGSFEIIIISVISPFQAYIIPQKASNYGNSIELYVYFSIISVISPFQAYIIPQKASNYGNSIELYVYFSIMVDAMEPGAPYGVK